MDTTYVVYELYPDGRESEVGTITMIQDCIPNILKRYDFGSYIGSKSGYDFAVVLTMFETIYGFTKGTNGFHLRWVDDYTREVGEITWKQPTWRIRKIENEPVQSE